MGPSHSSRDGRRIFARGVAPNGELLRYDQRARQWTPFLGGRSAEFLTFSPDRKSVAFVQFPDEVLYRVNFDGTGLLKLTEPPLAVREAQWSPDGSQILIDAQMENDSDKMYLISAQGGRLKRVIPDDKDEENEPHWSPDGGRIVYFNNAGAIRILDLASGRSVSLPCSEEVFSSRWSPDRRYIAALTVSWHKLRVFDLKSNSWTTLYGGVANFPTWSSDGQFIYFLRGPESDEIARVRVSGGTAESVASLKGMPGTGSW